MSRMFNDNHRKLTGNIGEDVAAADLESRGFTILRRNYSVHNVGEIDIIAGKGEDIYVFEVRSRLNAGSYPDSSESVTASKRRKVLKTAEHFIDEEDLYDRNIIFEVVKVTHDEQGNVVKIEYVPF